MSSSTKTKLLPAAAYAGCKIMGRHIVDKESGSIVLDWPGVRLEFSGITGTTSVKIRMNGNLAVFGYRVIEEATSHDFDDDKEDRLVILTGIKQTDYPLSLAATTGGTKLDPSKTYGVAIWKRDDPMNGGATIMGLVVDAEGLQKHQDQDKTKRLLEFVGDSDTVGFGVRGHKSSVWYFILCQFWTTLFNPTLRKSTDVTRSWAHLVATHFQADYHVIALSGVGAKYNAGDVKDDMTTMYSRLLGTKPKTNVEPKNVGMLGPTPSAIIMYIGQNDESALALNVENKLEAAFVGLLAKIRAYRPPPIPIVVVVPSPDAKLACQSSNQANRATAILQTKVWKLAVNLLKDDCIHVIENQHEPQIELNSPDEYGVCLHWNISGNRKWATGLIPKLAEVLRWE